MALEDLHKESRSFEMDEEKNEFRPLVGVSGLHFLYCFDTVWLGDRKDIRPVKNLCQLHPKVLFQNESSLLT